MPALSVLYLGGSGIISSACTQRCLDVGMEVFVLNRGRSTTRPLPDGCQQLIGDLGDPDSVRQAIGDRTFDVVADFRAFTPGEVESRLDIFRDRMGQYVFISSASAYRLRRAVCRSLNRRLCGTRCPNTHRARSRAKTFW